MKKKYLFFASLISSTLLLGSCSIPIGAPSSSSSISTSESVSSIASETATEEESFIREIVYVNEGSNGVSSNTITDAVGLVYDSVVTINAYLSNGYSCGAGVLYGYSDTSSYILTCHHVIEGATSYDVTLSNGKTYAANIVGGDPTTDIAVLKIGVTELTYATFIDNSDDIALGSTTIAIGNPLGILSNSVTKGIVSCNSRNITMSDGTVQELIQTDAAINSGNSGGGLFNEAGQLIGIVNAKYSATGVEGLAFAIPANTAKYIASELVSNGYVSGRYNLGITISDGVYNSGFYSRYEVTYISDVKADGCCYSKLSKNDILVSISIDYQDIAKEDISLSNVTSASEANSFLANSSLSIGDKIVFGVKRNGYNGQVSNIEVEVSQYKYRA